jgi:hypothetical protein
MDPVTGISEGSPAAVSVGGCNLEDPHHTRDGVFRAVGTCLSRIFTPRVDAVVFTHLLIKNVDFGDIILLSRWPHRAEIRSETAKSGSSAVIEFEKTIPTAFSSTGAQSPNGREPGHWKVSSGFWKPPQRTPDSPPRRLHCQSAQFQPCGVGGFRYGVGAGTPLPRMGCRS